MEHPRAVVFHLRLDEVKVPGLVVRNPHVQLPSHGPVGSLGVGPESREMSVRTGTVRELSNIKYSLLCIAGMENIHLILDIDILSMTEISFYKWVLQSC